MKNEGKNGITYFFVVCFVSRLSLSLSLHREPAHSNELFLIITLFSFSSLSGSLLLSVSLSFSLPTCYVMLSPTLFYLQRSAHSRRHTRSRSTHTHIQSYSALTDIPCATRAVFISRNTEIHLPLLPQGVCSLCAISGRVLCCTCVRLVPCCE